MRSIREIVWAAAIIEGEGCIVASVYQHRRKGELQAHPIRVFRLAVEMTDLDILIRLRDILGPVATIRQRKHPTLNPKHRDRYILQMTGAELAGWLMTIYPIMGDRRKARIRSALRVWLTMKTQWRYSQKPYTALRIAGT